MTLSWRNLCWIFAVILSACSASDQKSEKDDTVISDIKASTLNKPNANVASANNDYVNNGPVAGKPVVYQVFTRLFGNDNSRNKAWGTRDENGVGKFADFNDKALQEIKKLGVTRIWYTGVLHHATVTDYSEFGIAADDPDVVKGRAGSPYAIKDYYSVNPDLANDPALRLQEFKALIARSHANGLKVIIDIVPNHVARNYHSLAKPSGVEDFGASDDRTKEYVRDNNFYYVVGENFRAPKPEPNFAVLGGEAHPLADGQFIESPAKWTGNGSRLAEPKNDDWYETVKINYGVKPDGEYDFVGLDQSFAKQSVAEHYDFWQQQSVPSSWFKFRQIAEYWLDLGVDGFRYDVAELVPVEFWSYLNSAIKHKNPQAFLLAEIYQPHLYRDFIHIGKMDYLYDKVDFYDATRAIMQRNRAGKNHLYQNQLATTDQLMEIQHQYADIAPNLLHFLENHDEQRIASAEFVGDARIGKPAMTVLATISASPTMVYFAQALGEKAELNSGFGKASRTSIFDYAGVPSIQQWRNGGAYDGALLAKSQKELQQFYQLLLNLTAQKKVFLGEMIDTHSFNRKHSDGYSDRVISFMRKNEQDLVLVLANFDNEKTAEFIWKMPMESWLSVSENDQRLINAVWQDWLGSSGQWSMVIKEEQVTMTIQLKPLQSLILSPQLQ